MWASDAEGADDPAGTEAAKCHAPSQRSVGGRNPASPVWTLFKFATYLFCKCVFVLTIFSATFPVFTLGLYPNNVGQ